MVTMDPFKEIKQIAEDVYRVTSEPGDATRYDYFVIKYYDDFMFAPRENNFRYPQRINKWDVDADNIEWVENMSTKNNCNPWTVIECCKTIEDILKINKNNS